MELQLARALDLPTHSAMHDILYAFAKHKGPDEGITERSVHLSSMEANRDLDLPLSISRSSPVCVL